MNKNLSFLIILISLYACAQTNHLDKIEAVDNLFKKWNNSNSPGAAIGIIQDGEIVYSKGYGLANLEHNIPNSPQIAFNIGSNSKQFTAACIVLLSQQGKLDLNQSLSSIYSDFPEYAKTITIKNLLYHTSGLRDYAQITYLSGLRPDDYYNDEDILKWIRSQKELNYPTGEQYLYCNSGYWLLGQIVKKISGENLADFAQKEIFEPLGMTNTRFINNNTAVIKQRASGYSPSRSGSFRNISSTLEHIGDSGIYTTVEDMKKWDDEFYERNILKDTFWKLMTSQGVLNDGEIIDYAFGLEMKKHKGLKTIDHGGRVPGFWSNIIRFPEQKFSVIVFTNTSGANATPLGYEIADIFLEEKFKSPIENSKPERKIKFIKLSNETLKKYEASYWNADDKFSRKVFLKNDTLMFQRSPRSIHPLAPITTDEFKVLNTPPFIKAFVKFEKIDENYLLNITINDEKGSPMEVYTPVVYSTDDLRSFLGKYYSEEINAHYEFKMEGERIRLYLNGRRGVLLRHVRDELFTSPMCDIQFVKSGKNIQGVKISTPRVKNLSFIKVK